MQDSADQGPSRNGIIEKDLTLEISKYMYDRFKELGVPVDRPSVALSRFGNDSDVIIISNHINASEET